MRSVATGLILKRKLADFCHACSRRRVLGLFSSSSSGTVDPKKSYGGGGGEKEVPHLPVLIVGAGPVGLILSILLTKLDRMLHIIELRRMVLYANYDSGGSSIIGLRGLKTRLTKSWVRVPELEIKL